MAFILVDSNVLLDVITADPNWAAWSTATLEEQAEENLLAINAVIYTEVSIGFERIEDVEAALPRSLVDRLPIPPEAAFLAGKCFVQYRRRGGARHSTLPDFFIGAHAAVLDIPLVTRDVARYRTYFPKLRLIAPDKG